MSDIFVGDNDHGDVLPEPKCESCGVPWVQHIGIMGLCAEFAKLRKERDEANSLVRRILSEINCRIEHGADSNGHLEGLHGLYKKETP